MSAPVIESVLFLHRHGDHYEQCWASIEDNNFSAYERIRDDIPSSKGNKGNQLFSFQLKAGSLECKPTKLGVAALSKLMKNKDLPPHLYFFTLLVFDADKGDTDYRFACMTEDDRNTWLSILKAIAYPESLKQEKLLQKRAGVEVSPRAGLGGAASGSPRATRGAAPTMSLDNSFGQSRSRNRTRGSDDNDDSSSVVSINSKASQARKARARQGQERNEEDIQARHDRIVSPRAGRPGIGMGSNIMTGMQAQFEKARQQNESEDNEIFDDAAMRMMSGDAGDDIKEYRLHFGICSVKITNILRFFEVMLGYPGVILVQTLAPENSKITHSKILLYAVNLFVFYAVPILVTLFVLKEYNELWVQRLAITSVIGVLYLIPASFQVCSRVMSEWRSNHVVEGFFSFKPSVRMKWNFTNILQIIGCVLEWIQILVMILPAGVFSGITATPVINEYWPYWSYSSVYWVTISFVSLAAVVLILTAVLRGKTLYRYVNMTLPWLVLFLVGNVLFLSFCVILLMSLWCDYTVEPAVFMQDERLECYGSEHQSVALVGFIALGFLIGQHVFLPAGSFKETISDSLDIVFTPKYLTMQAVLKVIFAGIYVFFYHDSVIRIPWMTVVCAAMLIFNNRISPCCVANINKFRDMVFSHACMAGVTGSSYLLYLRIWKNTDYVDQESKWLYLYILLAALIFSSIWFILYILFNKNIPESAVASGFVEIESNPSGIGVGSRIMEPLVALALSNDADDHLTAQKYSSKLASLVKHRAERVQFMALWAMASMSLHDEDARVYLHNEGSTRTVLELYDTFTPLVQLEAIAFLANMSLSDDVAETMVRKYNCIPFVTSIVNGHNASHSLFALICLANLTRREVFREQIRCANGIQAMVNSLMSHDYNKRKFGALALSNMALSESAEMDMVLKTRGLIERVIKMATRREVETQKEIVALVRNLACHKNLRPILLDAGIMNILHSFHDSVHPGVTKWADEIDTLMRREIASGSLEDYKGSATDVKKRSMAEREDAISQHDREFIQRMVPLEARVEWSTWGSKLTRIFGPLIANVPKLEQERMTCECAVGEKVLINLSICLSANTYVQWRNDAKYILTSLPSQGVLTHYEANYDFENGQTLADTDSVVYTPNADAHGRDNFSFIVQLGAATTSECVITVVLDDSVGFGTSSQPKGWCGCMKGQSGEDDYDEEDYSGEGKRESEYFASDSSYKGVDQL